mgnify:CR=1 FL=1
MASVFAKSRQQSLNNQRDGGSTGRATSAIGSPHMFRGWAAGAQFVAPPSCRADPVHGSMQQSSLVAVASPAVSNRPTHMLRPPSACKPRQGHRMTLAARSQRREALSLCPQPPLPVPPPTSAPTPSPARPTSCARPCWPPRWAMTCRATTRRSMRCRKSSRRYSASRRGCSCRRARSEICWR